MLVGARDLSGTPDAGRCGCRSPCPVRVSGGRYQGRPVTVMARATSRLIDRGDLLAALDRASARKVTIISAPAGSGKTSLLRTWADRPDQAHRLAVVRVR